MPTKDTRGGYRPNAGRKKGTKNTRTVLKEKIAKELELREQIADDIRMLLPMGVRKKGVAALKEISKEEIESEVNKRIGYHAHKLLNAQLSLALGTQHLYKVKVKYDRQNNMKKEHILVSDPQEIKDYLDDPSKVQGDDYFVITTKTPSETAINSALDRLLGKASTKIVGANNPDGSEGPIKVIVANFSQQQSTPTVGAETAAANIAETAIHEAIEDEDVAHQSPASDEEIQENTENPENIHGN